MHLQEEKLKYIKMGKCQLTMNIILQPICRKFLSI